MGAGLLQPTHVIFVIVIALLVFGPKRLPEMGRAIGEGIREFKGSFDGDVADADVRQAAPRQESARVSSIPPAAPVAEPGAPRAAKTPPSASPVSR